MRNIGIGGVDVTASVFAGNDVDVNGADVNATTSIGFGPNIGNGIRRELLSDLNDLGYGLTATSDAIGLVVPCHELVDQLLNVRDPLGCDAGAREFTGEVSNESEIVIRHTVLGDGTEIGVDFVLTPRDANCGEPKRVTSDPGGGTLRVPIPDGCNQWFILPTEGPSFETTPSGLDYDNTSVDDIAEFRTRHFQFTPTAFTQQINQPQDASGPFTQFDVFLVDGDCLGDFGDAIFTFDFALGESSKFLDLPQVTSAEAKKCVYEVVATDAPGQSTTPKRKVGSPGDSFDFITTLDPVGPGATNLFTLSVDFAPDFGFVERSNVFDRVVDVSAEPDCRSIEPVLVLTAADVQLDLSGCTGVVSATLRPVEGIIDTPVGPTTGVASDGAIRWLQRPDLNPNPTIEVTFGEQNDFIEPALHPGFFDGPPTATLLSGSRPVPGGRLSRTLSPVAFKFAFPAVGDDAQVQIGSAAALAADSRARYLIPADLETGGYTVEFTGTLLNGQPYRSESRFDYVSRADRTRPSVVPPEPAPVGPIIDSIPPVQRGQWEQVVVELGTPLDPTPVASTPPASGTTQDLSTPGATAAAIQTPPLAATGTDSDSLSMLSLLLVSLGAVVLACERHQRRRSRN